MRIDPTQQLVAFLGDIERSGELDRRPPSPNPDAPQAIQQIHAAIDSLLQTLARREQQEQTARVALEAERTRLSSLEQDHQTLLNAIGEHALVSTAGLDGRITYINERFQAVTQYRPEEIIGRTHATVSSGIHPRGYYETLWRTIGDGQVWHGEICNRRKDGSLFWVDAAIVPTRAADGGVSGYTAVSLDITARKEDAARTHASLATLRALLETIPYPIFLKDRDLRYVECNEEFCRMMGRPRHEIIGGTPFDIAPAELAAIYVRSDYDLLKSATGQQVYENQQIGSDGTLRQVMFHKRVHRNLENEPEGVVGIAIDVTEFRNTEAELRRHRDHLQELVDERTADLLRAKEEAERANQAKSEFIANITHELRTPLHAILSFAKLSQARLKNGALDTVAEFLEDIHQAGKRQLALVDDLLDLSKIEAGKMTITPALQDIRPLLEASVRGVASLLESKEMQLDWQIETETSVAWADATRMQQVFANLLSNAIKFSPHGAPLRLRLSTDRLQAGRRRSDGMQAALRIELSDAGPGIPEAELTSIFDKFIQSGRTKDGSGGTGLGLAISLEIVLAHGGRIAAHNNPEGGATFSVLLPMQAPGRSD